MAAAAAAAVVVVGVAVLLVNEPDGTDVTTVASSADDTGVAAPLEAAEEPQGPALEELSVVPVLQWSEIDPPFENAHGLQSVGDGRILVRARNDGGDRVVVTTNGTDWTELPIPDGISTGHIDISGDRWLVTGFDARADSSLVAGIERVFYSDDEGGTWNELRFNLAPDPAVALPYVVEASASTSALVSGRQVVIAVARATYFDLLSLLVDRGVLPDGLPVGSVGLRWGGGVVAIESLDVDGDESEITEVTYEQLGLTADQQTRLEAPSAGDWIRIFSSDGSTPELTAEYKGYASSGIATADGFMLHIQGPEDLLVASRDGDAWVEVPMDSAYVYPLSPVAIDGDGAIWGVATVGGAASIVKSLDLVNDPETVTILPGVEAVGRLAAGPAGLTAAALPSVNNVTGPEAPHDPWPWAGLDVMVGWSAQGVEWQWQTMDDAFGVSKGEPYLRLAVGEDFILAHVVIYEEPFVFTEITPPQVGAISQGPSIDPLASRWFIASVP